MKILQRYVLAETIKVLIMTLVALAGFLLLAGAVRQGMRKGLPVTAILETLPFLMPEILRFAIPASFLFAVCSVFGYMSSSGEMIAIKSLGINPLRVVIPVLVLSYALSLVTFWMYDLCASWGRPGMQRKIAACVDQMVYRTLQSDGIFEAGPITLMATGVRDGQLLEPRVTIRRTGEPSVYVSARTASLNATASEGQLHMHFHDGRVEVDGNSTLTFPDTFDRQFSLIPTSRPDHERSPAELPLYAIRKQIKDERELVASLDESISLPMDEEMRRVVQGDLTAHRGRWYRLRAEPHRRMANGFAVLAFALIGIPISLSRQASDTMTIMFLCFFPVLLLYYPILVMGEEIARKGYLPEVSVWLAPTALSLIGVFLYRRTVRL